ncbi:MAG TPA: hypothetical protein ENF34_04325 [Candidatus Bathyarchaeota archaeon]|nr:hypothetical protein [Candidatus Bathyarchaeota archaeon]
MTFSFLSWLLRACICSTALVIASALDIKCREIPDELWLAAGPITGALTLFWLLERPNLAPMAVLSISLAALIAALIYYSGLTGGADAKALVFIAISMPLTQEEFLSTILAEHPFLPMASFSNALVLSVLLSMGILARNLAWRLRTGEPFFEGLEGSALTKALVLISGYKVRKEDFLRSSFLFPLEAPSGSGGRRLTLVVRLDEEREREVRGWLAEFQGPEYVWVSPGLPFVVFLTGGFILALVHGDVLFHAIHRTIKFLLGH